MFRNYKICICLLVMFLMVGCGNGTTGTGNTVYISASTKDGETGVVFGQISSNVWVANPISVTLKSTPYTTNSSVDNSDVIITRVTFKYIPLNGAFDFNPPTISYLDMSYAIEPGGTTDIDNIPLLYTQDMQKIAASATASTQAYKVEMTFSGVEVNTGQSVSTPYNSTATVFIQ